MRGAGILDGDVAILDGAAEVGNGAIAAVLIEDEATLKRVYLRRNGLLLRGENPTFCDIEISADGATTPRVLGVLVGLVRRV
jgi:repressor LexA